MKKIVLVLGVLLILAVGYAVRIERTVDQCKLSASRYGTLSPFTLDERPSFGFSNRVLSVDELKVGGIYVACDLERGTAEAYWLRSTPYEGYGQWLEVDVIVLNTRRWGLGLFEDNLFLSDMGVIPYDNGTWNPVWVLLRLLPIR